MLIKIVFSLLENIKYVFVGFRIESDEDKV